MAEHVTILLAEDDPDDRLFIRRAFRENNVRNNVHEVENGAQLLEFLRNPDAFESSDGMGRPCLILLDLNMPKMSGREALRELKSDPHLRSIPVVVLTTSNSESDVVYSYAQGANAYVTKPSSLTDLIDLFKRLDSFWLRTAKLPTAYPRAR